ncbi:MAG: hypothetical protein FWF06_06620 [Symbiobacteriaceae bacterium]|nr:hypothetical protein [Symbiobacteriaceae bacterium]
MINSHPRRFTPIAGATYAQRPGNFLNHAYIGNFTQQYLWELMHLPELWYAQQEDEGYYYREPPTPLPVLTSLPAPSAATSAITLKEIAHFIAAGRQEGLAQAVAFLLEQYQLPPSQRRYLIISEVNSREMELWLAAIQMAFSPRMAAALSFATRLDRFTGSNRYTVNRSGSYMPQINLQDPEQTLRYRAMILGLDARDHINLRELRPGSAAPYVVLDGKKGKAYFTQDISHPYFTLITTFSPTHLSFGRDFLQDTTLTQPNYQIFQLYEVYTMLLNFALPPVLNND